MKKNAVLWKIGGGLALFVVASMMETGCASTNPAVPVSNGAHQDSGKGGSQLWQENCQRCHNFRSPDTLNDAQWEVAVHHMRIRGNLTAEEHKAIVEFLKAGN